MAAPVPTPREQTVVRALEIDRREQRLPRWAQDKLELLRRCVNDANRLAELARGRFDPSTSDTVLYDYEGGPIGLGDRPEVRFYVGPGRGEDDYLAVRIETGRRLQRFVEIRGVVGVQLHPIASNVVAVTPDRHLR